MRQHLFIGLVGMLAVLLGSCGGGNDTAQESPSPSSSATASPSPSVSAAQTASPQPSAAQSFASPLVAQQQAKEPAVPGLVQSTNEDTHLKGLQKGRRDPFALIPIQPTVKPSPVDLNNPNPPIDPASIPKPVPTIPIIPPPPNLSIGAQPTSSSVAKRVPPSVTARSPKVTASAGSNQSKPRATNASPQKAPSTGGQSIARGLPSNARSQATPPSVLPSFKPELPKLPEPTLAESVEVSGVVQVGNRPQAIVKAPNEPTSRYVGVGQRLANGQVLVKRIEMNEGSSPVVILEQYGIEVAKAVGEKAGPNQQPGRPTAAVPTKVPGLVVSFNFG